MSARRDPRGVGFGFLALAVALFGLAVFLASYAISETRIGRGLLFEGEAASALVVTAERTERSQCSRSQRSVCWPANITIATVVFEVDGLRTGSEVRLTPDEYVAYEGGEEVFVDLFYLPADPRQVERTRGSRLTAAERDIGHVYILSGFGLLCAAIGIIALVLGRKEAAPPSTGQGR